MRISGPCVVVRRVPRVVGICFVILSCYVCNVTTIKRTLPEKLFHEVYTKLYRFYRFTDQYESSISEDLFKKLINRFITMAKTLEGFLRSKYVIKGVRRSSALFPIYSLPVRNYLSTLAQLRVQRVAPSAVVDTFDKVYAAAMDSIMRILDD
ncbi:uncharacterized protein [Dermacentor albipictus]|uniref:uncharacterized protein isoform X2 n=1 Tax=Dermacentor albipictus TaxID=60249 RepID=UPI0031FDA3B1